MEDFETKVYTVEEVSKILRVSKNYVYELIKTGKLPVLKFKSYRIKASSLEKFLTDFENGAILVP